MDTGIAIVGMGCRLPGDVKSIPQFWDLLSSGRCAQSDVPANRFNIENWYHPDSKRHGSIASKGGYFLGQDESYRQFDPSFFGIHPLEASSMDPQQRKLLEVVYETFESAGVTLQQVSGSRTACYVGTFTHDYKNMNARDTEDYAPYMSTGSDMTVLSNRINYVFNMKGPSLTVDTACSSSLYALHLACQGLRAGDFDAAVVAGTNIIMDVRHQIVATKLGILSPTSTCHTFDASADGFGRAEGITALYIKRVSDAYRNRDPIRAVIRASAINTNGKGIGITHPGSLGQEEVIRHAYSNANLDFGDTGYVECHGTGTPVGDPIEVEAIGSCFATGRTVTTPLVLSALKSQIGHTEGASGIAGVQKAVLSMEQGMIPATIGIEQINPALNLRSGKLRIARQLEKWPVYFTYGRVSINSFGYGGANAHAIIDATDSFFLAHTSQTVPMAWTRQMEPNRFQTDSQRRNSDGTDSKILLVTSAHSTQTLQENTIVLTKSISRYDTTDLAYTLSLRRSHFHHRSFCIATRSSANVSLSEWKAGTSKPKTPNVAFVFTGQGAQWPRMGMQLIESFHVARKTFTELQNCLNSISERPDWTLHEALSARPEESLMMKDVVVSVTLCTAVQVMLVDLLRSWNVNPTAVVGHSSGEAAAASCAGYLTLSETIITSYYRAISLQRNPDPGLMMAVGLGEDEAKQYVSHHDQLHLACHNSPQSVTIAGLPMAVEQLEKELQSRGIFARIVKSSGFANHSPFVQRAADYFVDNFADSVAGPSLLKARKPLVPMYSCITGNKIDCVEVGAKYWSQNIAAPVLFDEALQSLLRTETTVDFLIELGPHSALAGPIRQTKTKLGGKHTNTDYLPSLIRGSDGVIDMLKLAGNLFNIGYPLDLARVNSSMLTSNVTLNAKHIVDLPTYQWTYQNEISMAEQRIGHAVRFRKHPRHDLLGTQESASTPDCMIWRNMLKMSEVPWIKDHVIGTSVLFPACGYVAMAIEAMTQYSIDTGLPFLGHVLRNIRIMRPLVLSESTAIEVVFEMVASIFQEDGEKNFEFKISSVSSDNQWIQYTTGKCAIFDDNGAINISATKPQSLSEHLPGISYDLYHQFAEVGLKYGLCFQTLRDLRLLRNKTARASIRLKPTDEVMNYESKYQVHPATMDGCLQAAFAANACVDSSDSVPRAFLPNEIPYMRVWQSSSTISDETADVISQVYIQRPQSINAKFQLNNNNGDCMIDGVVRLAAVTGLAKSDDATVHMPEPYQRCVWAVDIDCISGSIEVDEFSKMAIPSCCVRQGQIKHVRKSIAKATDNLRPNKSETATFDLENTNGHCPNDDVSSVRTLSVLLQLIAHHRPHLKYLEVGLNGPLVEFIFQNAIKDLRYVSCTSVKFIRDEVLSSQNADVQATPASGKEAIVPEITSEEIDIIVITDVQCPLQVLQNMLSRYRKLQSMEGFLVIRKTETSAIWALDALQTCLHNAGYGDIQFYMQDMSLVFAKASTSAIAQMELGIASKSWILYQHDTHFLRSLIASISKPGLPTELLHFSEIDKLPEGARAIVLFEVEHSLFVSMNQGLLTRLQKLFKNASSIDWIYGMAPELSLIPGMAKSLRMEMPRLELRCVQIDHEFLSNDGSRAITLLRQFLLYRPSTNSEKHIIIHDNRLHIMRYVIDEAENSKDSARVQGNTKLEPYEGNLRMTVSPPGSEALYQFKEENDNPYDQLQENQVRIQPLLYGINSQNVSSLQEQIQKKWFSYECFGKVLEVANHTHLEAGDYVVYLGGTTLGSRQILDSTLCVPCQAESEAAKLVGLLEYLCVAYYALVVIGHVNEGQYVLINSDDSTLVSIVQTIADHLGASTISMTSENSHQMVTGPTQSLLKNHKSVTNDIGNQPCPRRFAVVIDTIGNLHLDQIAHLLSPETRLVLAGPFEKFRAFTPAALNSVKRGVSVTYIDAIELTESEPEYMREILTSAIQLSKKAKILSTVASPQTFSIEKLEQAIESISKNKSSSIVRLSCDPTMMVPVYRRVRSNFQLRSDGQYLLVGCLGGLGRSIASWMLDHGARHFIFLSRSGVDKAEARSFVAKLQTDKSVTVQMVRGDVTVKEDVRRAVASVQLPLRGVIQAASTFNECRFKDMDVKTFNKVIKPKVHGTIYLHEETLNHPLDFFVMTSSSIGITGATTQSHYAAGNAFLDSFASYRRSLGRPACSLSLGMVIGVGHVHDEGLQDVLQRRGSYGISEAEFLRMMELACSGGSSQPSTADARTEYPWNPSLIITGLDPTKLIRSQASFEWALNDPSLSHITHAVKTLAVQNPSETVADAQSPLANLPALLRDDNSGDSELERALQLCVVTKLSSLISIPVTELEESLHRHPLSDLGLDSIVAADFQAWARRDLAVSIDFMEMLAGGQTVGSLTDMIMGRLKKGNTGV